MFVCAYCKDEFKKKNLEIKKLIKKEFYSSKQAIPLDSVI